MDSRRPRPTRPRFSSRPLALDCRFSGPTFSHQNIVRIPCCYAVVRKADKNVLERKLTLAEIFLIAGTRVALGAGIGLLLSNKLSKDQRNAAGLALTLVGALTTVPLALNVIGKKAPTTSEIRGAA